MSAITTIDVNLPSDLPSEILGLAIQGQNLGGAVMLGELLGYTASAPPTILAFIRHFG